MTKSGGAAGALCLGCFSLMWKNRTRGSYPHDLAPNEIFRSQKPAILGIFPNGKPRARGAPKVDHFHIRSLADCPPFPEVENPFVYNCAAFPYGERGKIKNGRLKRALLKSPAATKFR